MGFSPYRKAFWVIMFLACLPQMVWGYCTASGGGDEYIYNVTVGTINNTTGNNGYTDYTALSTSMEIGVPYNLSVIGAVDGTPYLGYSGDILAVWVDWNHDDDFYDPNEQVLSISNYGYFTGSITPPATALSGSTRMRIRLQYGGTPSPCGTTTFGEVEDYTINVGGSGDYCAAQSGTSSYMYISHVDFEDIHSYTLSSTYSDFTQTINAELTVGQSYVLAVENGKAYTGDQCVAWIDWNQDNDFYDGDPNEYYQLDGGPASFSKVITVPANATSGETRLRLRIMNTGTPQSCGTIYYGEVEDYTVNIVAGDYPIISGHVLINTGQPMEGITVVSPQLGTTTTNAQGYYEFQTDSNPWDGSVDIEINELYWIVDPAAYYLYAFEDETDIDFTCTYRFDPDPTISGYIRTSGGQGIADVLVTASTGETAYTNTSGYYAITVSAPGELPGPWTGDITPSKAGWTFNPSYLSFFGLTQNSSNKNFTGTELTPPVISGYILDAESDGVSNITVTTSDASASDVTDGAGYYELTVAYGWSGTVTPQQEWYTFNPVNRSYTNVTSNQGDQNYLATYTGDEEPVISGYVRDGTGQGIPDVCVYTYIQLSTTRLYLSSGITDETGFYEIIAWPVQEMGLMAFKADWSFLPETIVIPPLGQDLPGQNLTATYIGNGCADRVFEDWLGRYAAYGRQYRYENSRDIALDYQGNICVVGECVANQGDTNGMIVKYTPDCAIPLWTVQYDGPGSYDDNFAAVAVDVADNIYATGDSSTAATYEDIVTVKYAPSGGAPLWVARYDNPQEHGSDEAKAIAVDAEGNVYVTGGSDTDSMDTDVLTIKYNTDGVKQWVKYYDHTAIDDRDEATEIALDSQGNCYVAGYVDAFGTEMDIVTIKYDPDGVQLWVRQYNGPGNAEDCPYDLKVDSQGRVFVVGESQGAGTEYDMITLIYDTDGALLHEIRQDGAAHGDDSGGTIVLNELDSCFYIGGTMSIIDEYDGDLTVWKYDYSGVLDWVYTYAGDNNLDDIAIKMEMDRFGNIYVAGIRDYYHSIQGMNMTAMLLRLSPSSRCLWQQTLSDIGMVLPTGIAVDDEMNIYCTAMGIDCLTFKYSQCFKPGDVDYSLTVDTDDLMLLSQEWLLPEPTMDIAPEGGDGVVNLLDVALLAAEWLDNVE